jgi:hypothetical protein
VKRYESDSIKIFINIFNNVFIENFSVFFGFDRVNIKSKMARNVFVDDNIDNNFNSKNEIIINSENFEKNSKIPWIEKNADTQILNVFYLFFYLFLFCFFLFFFFFVLSNQAHF